MNTLHRIFATFLLTVCAIVALAAQVNVTITPKRTVLPPQVMLYIANPGQYFNISVQNPDNEAVAIFFGAEVHQLMPTRAIDIVVPAKTMPKQGIVIFAGQTRMLDAVQLRTLFNHVRQADVEMPRGLFDNVASGSFGLLEEGTYEIVLNAYKWDPTLSSPVLLSNPTLSRCTFTVCYQAGAPRWVSPVSTNDYADRSICTLSEQVPMLQWTAPAVSCNPTPIQYTYDLKVVQQLPLQAPDEAIERNPVVYQKASLTVPQCLIPATVVKNFAPTATYVAQITVRSNNKQEGVLDYVNLQNGGRSDLLLFRVKDNMARPEKKDTVKTPKDSTDYTASIKQTTTKDSLTADSLYAFRNPVITAPAFMTGVARKCFVENDIRVAWREVRHVGGEGLRPDTLKFTYEVQLFTGKADADKAEVLKGKPFYTKRVKDNESLTDSIPWTTIAAKVQTGGYMVLRILPRCVNERSVQYKDSANVIDFALADYLSRYFQCSNGLEITNATPTKLTAKELKNKTVTIGEYDLVLDGKELKAGKKDGHFSGTGHVIWKPLKFTWKLAVKFTDIAINTDNEVYEGLVETFEGDNGEKIAGEEWVDSLFTDWGIDNLIGDTRLPCADKVDTKKADGTKANLAENLDGKMAAYYELVKKGVARVPGLLQGDVKDVKFPLDIPDEINPTPVNIQISKMKFAPTYATMDFFGIFVVPETRATKNQILVFGAPRICISPKSLLPEGATIALLKDFTVKDPATGYDCTFKAPKDVVRPADGCYLSWSDSKFEALKIDVDMTLPNLKKVENGKVTDKQPKLHVVADVKAPFSKDGVKQAGWDWFGEATLDAFQHDDLPGYTFHAGDKVVVDHSSRENVQGMPRFPMGYDFKKAELNAADTKEWMGVYIRELTMEFPKDIKIGNGKEAMKVGLFDMFIDKSGMTVEAGIVNALNYSRNMGASIGGFGFSMDTISVNFVQNQHRDFRLCGTMRIPLLQGTIHYACNIYNQRVTGKGTKQGYAYVFKTYQMKGLNLNFVLGDLSLNEKLTYLLVEALPDEQGELHTNVELLLGGSVTIAGTKSANQFIKEKTKGLPLELTLPGLKFCKMRVANNEKFESVYERAMQQRAMNEAARKKDENNKTIRYWNEAKTYELIDGKLYFSFGQWGYASPQKKIGPFEFTISKVSGNYADKMLSLALAGKVKFCDELSIEAGTGIKVNSELVVPKDLFDLSGYSLEYKNVDFDSARIGFSMTGFAIDGKLSVTNKGKEGGGYTGSVKVNVGDDVFKLEAIGGYYQYKSQSKNFAYGFFKVKAGGSKIGVPMGPISLTGLTGGLYFNCVYNPKKEDEPQVSADTEGAIGILFGVGLATVNKDVFGGDFEFAVCVMPQEGGNGYRLSTFKLDGEMKCLGGVITSDVSIVYQNDARDRYFQLLATVDAKSDAAVPEELKDLSEDVEEARGPLEKLTNGFKDKLKQKAKDLLGVGKDNATDSFKEAMGDKNKHKTGKTEEDAAKEMEKQTEGDKTKKEVKYGGPTMNLSLDVRIQSKKNGRDCSPVAWHVYFGEPDVKKRCSFTFVDFKSKFVTVIVGANAYLCLGSELPGDGQLPPLPAEVQEFLDGAVHGKAKSDNMSKAVSAQQRTLREIMANQKVDGGVMLGAQVFGKIDVDLGLFYAKMGATAGLDISIVKLSGNAQCVNLGGKPGYKGWYGSGQLYAYLYAKLGFRVLLGFFNTNIDLMQAGLGGVLEARMPNPNYFHGKCRAELKLLGGLVHINKTFQFTCGDYCQTFLGNALDEYRMFGDISMGYDKVAEAVEKPYSAVLGGKPQVTTTNTLDRSIRVLDPTEEDRIKHTSGGEGAEEFGALASRTFRFHLTDSVKPYIQEFDDTLSMRKGVEPARRYLDYTISSEQVILNVTRLKPGKIYRITLSGCAQEFRTGRWTDPENWDSIKGHYRPVPWHQKKCYYIATRPAGEVDYVADYDSITGAVDLLQFVKLAYPMAYDDASRKKGLVLLKSMSKTYVNPADLRRPMISLSEDISGKYFNKGALVWKLYNDNKKLIDSVPNKWITANGLCLMTPARAFSKEPYNQGEFTLRLDYQLVQRDSVEGWTTLRSSTVYGGAAALEAADQMKTTYKDGKKYRVSTQLDDNDKQKYTVKVEQLCPQFSTRLHIDTLVNLFVKVTNDTSVVKYDDAFMATRLDAVYPDYGAGTGSGAGANSGASGEGFSFPALSDEQLFGYSPTANTLSGFRKYLSRPWITIDPFAYLSYMANLNFVSGYRVKTGSYGLDITTTGGLAAQTPFDETFWEMGQSEGQKFNEYQIEMGYNNNVNRLFLANSRYENEQTVYPLRLGDSRVGEGVGVRKWVPRSAKEIVTMFNNLSSVAEQLGNDLDAKLTERENAGWDNKQDWKPWLETHKDKYAIFTAGTDEGNTYTLRVPYYQYAIVRMGGWNQSDDNVKTSEGNSGYDNDLNKDEVRHWRFYKPMAARAFYLSSAWSWNGQTRDRYGLDLYSCDGSEDPTEFAKSKLKNYSDQSEFFWRPSDKKNRLYVYKREQKSDGTWGGWKKSKELKGFENADEAKIAELNAQYAAQNSFSVEYKVEMECRAFRLYVAVKDKANGNFRSTLPNGNLYKAQFKPTLASSLKKMKCTDYRVNAWNIDDQCWTVYGGDEAEEANKTFFTVYTYTYDGKREVLSNGFSTVGNAGSGNNSSSGGSAQSGSGSGSHGGSGSSAGTSTNSGTGGASASGKVPTLKASVSKLSFSANKGGKQRKSFTVSGTNLKGLIHITVNDEAFSVDKTTIQHSNHKASGTVTVTFDAYKGGTFSNAVRIESAGAEPVYVDLTATCDRSIVPSAKSIAFGSVRLNEQTTKEVTVRRLNLNKNIKVTSDNPFFTVHDNDLNKDNYSTTLKVHFKPMAAGEQKATLTLQSEDVTKTITLNGSGKAPKIKVKAKSLNFESTKNKEVSKMTVVDATNIGYNQGITVKVYGEGFSVESDKIDNDDNGRVMPRTFKIKFKPKGMGNYEGMVKFYSLGADTVTVKLTGTCPGYFEPSTTAIDFGTTRVRQFQRTVVGVKRDGLGENIKLTVEGEAQHFSLRSFNHLVVKDLTELNKDEDETGFYVLFDPKTGGTHTATIKLTSGSLTKTIRLKGTAKEPVIRINKSALTFEGRKNKETQQQVIVNADNIGYNQGIKVSVTGTAFTVDKKIDNDDNGAVKNKVLTVKFKPAGMGTYNETLTLSSKGAATQIIKLTGTCPGDFEPSVTALDFGTIRVQQPVKKEIEVKREGLAEKIQLSVIGDVDHFQLSTSTLDKDRSSGSFFVTYKPQAGGNHRITITLASGTMHKTITAKGSARKPAITINKTSLEFHGERYKESSQKVVVNGVSIGYNQGIKVTVAGKGYTVSTPKLDNDDNGRVNNKTLTVKFTPTGMGDYPGTITLSSQGATPKVIELKGTCAGGFEPSVTALDFGTQRLLQPVEKRINVKREGLGEVIRVSASGDTQHFSLSATVLRKDIGEGDFGVTYKPLSGGNHRLTISLTSGNMTKTITVKGRGLQPLIHADAASLAFIGKKNETQKKSFTVSAYNVGYNQNVKVSVSGQGYTVEPKVLNHDKGRVNDQTVTVTFKPTGMGDYPGTVTLSTEGATTKTVKLSGTCAGSITPNVSTLNFGTVRLLEKMEKIITVDTEGLGEDIQLSMSDPSQGFSLSTTKLNKDKRRSTFTVIYCPSSVGNNRTTVRLTSGGLTKEIKVSGSGAEPSLTVAVPSLSFEARKDKEVKGYVYVNATNVPNKYGVMASITGTGFTLVSNKILGDSHGRVTNKPFVVKFKRSKTGVYEGTLKVAVLTAPGQFIEKNITIKVTCK